MGEGDHDMRDQGRDRVHAEKVENVVHVRDDGDDDDDDDKGDEGDPRGR
jgi:hypothetical protein